MILTVVNLVVGRACAELQRGPVLWVGIVGDPGDTPELQALWIVQRCFTIREQLVEILGSRFDTDTQRVLPHLYQGGNFIVCVWNTTRIGQPDRGHLRNARPALFLQALLEERLGL